MIIKHYFLNERDREAYEQKLLEQDSSLDLAVILQLDDRELLEFYEARQYAYSL